ncbi:hypothetical protein [Thermodesulfatator autotrophicus]|uniref:Haem-binding uptake Tiki superfamily ChaN domain-containing protein n=1 Tax=Thermodesulfatator autotrophicus TaxID=1795632 RepID=A0A177E7E9_9BACT|nr:hypothetical protein [Thermodesulfatator autotrophicus]OAG27864.1 hypothetical protein TH606_04850 [Thermodesulfatator autotrophicus]
MDIVEINANFDSDYQLKQLISRKDIFLLGTIHRLKEAQDILKDFLLLTNPAVITVEISPYSLSWRRKREKLWLNKFEETLIQEKLPLTPALESLKMALAMPYEYKIARDLNIAPVIPIDLNKPAKKYLKELESALNPENLKKLATMPLSPQKEKALARLFLKKLYQPSINFYDRKREAYMAQKIKILAKRRPLVHIGGWRHLAGLSSYFKDAFTGIILP